MSPLPGFFASEIQGHLNAPAGAYDSLGSVTVGAGGTTSITFTGIPTGYKHLQIRAYAPTGNYMDLRFNGDTTSSNYRSHALFTGGSGTPSSITAANAAYFPWSGGWSSPWSAVMDILDYSNTNKNKTLRILEGYDANGSGELYFNSILWMSTSPITSMTLSRSGASVGQYSKFAMYGIK
jgi:hypothetical protein